ncbi:DNA alkylation repair protein [Gemella haemolysans]|uniref:DNA alkylation repair enzyme n=1 Tax=Gemella haemolysans ATCC 10379 TaxID=546270 RepID=C5NV83_9BACL|nr:DNA alkylation repair protein [Gemella haemolysans]EER68899.1 DNA alkylation repair enzyme [Gemella haemolysans ATCC 10379]KAA8707015.1 DNA alkylation repair protein [Gemella haemolysans]UBH81881.1 DNA alkylation repair protein [Gemella haemolysans]VEI38202.1 DNA alkylation repair enzyme [Gemella haemolysans]
MKLLDLITDFEENRNELLAESMSKYMKDKFRFLGVRGTTRTEIYKKYFPDTRKTKIIDWDFVESCWNKEEREFQYVVVYYLKAMQKFLKREDISRLKYLIVTKSWWDTVDLLAKVIGSLVIRIEGYDQIMLEWSKDSNIWLKRVAILYQLSLKEKVDKQILERILVGNLGDSEFFINKAIGWALRDYSKYNPEWVREFIKKNKDNMANLSIREASKYI